MSNFNAALLAKIEADPRTKITPAVNQCNHAIGNHNASHSPESGGDDATVSYCKAHGISYSAFSPLEGLHGGNVFKLPAVSPRSHGANTHTRHARIVNIKHTYMVYSCSYTDTHTHTHR